MEKRVRSILHVEQSTVTRRVRARKTVSDSFSLSYSVSPARPLLSSCKPLSSSFFFDLIFFPTLRLPTVVLSSTGPELAQLRTSVSSIVSSHGLEEDREDSEYTTHATHNTATTGDHTSFSSTSHVAHVPGPPSTAATTASSFPSSSTSSAASSVAGTAPLGSGEVSVLCFNPTLLSYGLFSFLVFLPFLSRRLSLSFSSHSHFLTFAATPTESLFCASFGQA